MSSGDRRYPGWYGVGQPREEFIADVGVAGGVAIEELDDGDDLGNCDLAGQGLYAPVARVIDGTDVGCCDVGEVGWSAEAGDDDGEVSRWDAGSEQLPIEEHQRSAGSQPPV